MRECAGPSAFFIMIQFEKVRFGYEAGSDLLKELSFRVESGEKVCLLGLNGSGKSTLLKLAAGLLTPSQGEITVADCRPDRQTSLRDLRSKLAFVFQNPQDQIVATSVGADLAFTLENLAYPTEEIGERLELLSRKFRLGAYLDRHPSTLSAGQQQRTALAGALASDPEVALVDEPTSFLDHEGTTALFENLLSKDDLTVLAATQFPEEALMYDRVLLLQEGKIAFSGTAQSLFGGPVWKELLDSLPNFADPERESGRNDCHGAKVEAKDVTYGYSKGQPVLENLRLQAEAGEITAVLGSSGSGKSTTGLLLAGLLQPESGRVVRTDTSNSAPRVGYLMQFPESQFFAETVAAEVGFAVSNQGLGASDIARRVGEAMHEIGLSLEVFGERSPFTLSGGEQRRVALASVLVMQPDILVMDEPTVALDWRGAKQLLHLLFRLRRQGRVVILLSHDFNFVARAASQLVLLDGGQVLWSGARVAADFPEELFVEKFGDIPSALRLARRMHQEGASIDEMELALSRSILPA